MVLRRRTNDWLLLLFLLFGQLVYALFVFLSIRISDCNASNFIGRFGENAQYRRAREEEEKRREGSLFSTFKAFFNKYGRALCCSVYACM